MLSSVCAQPDPCGVDEMTSTCLEACVVCDIDGFTGRNNLTVQGQTFPNFCTTIFHNMSYIAFIAGTEDLTINVTVSSCTIGRGVEIGIFESLDCNTFTAITDCNTDVAPNGTATFSNLVPLVVGQHYYLVIDGSMGDICDWTFNVLEGSTVVGALTTSGIIQGPEELCPDLSATYSTEGEVGATLFYWTVNDVAQDSNTQEIDIVFPTDGSYQLCVTAANVCDQAPPTCTTINVVSPEPLLLTETRCTNECIEVAGETICASGAYEFVVPLPNGCDSLIFLDLVILPEVASNLDINLCIGEAFFIDEIPYSSTGVFVQTIQTNRGCDSVVTLDLTMIECEISGVIDFTSPVCNGDENGTLFFSLDNGTPPFNYAWHNITSPSIGGAGTTDLFTDILIENIPAGLYEINVVDDFGNDVVFIQEVIDPPVLALAVSALEFNGYNLTCDNASDGTATATGNGGVAPYTYVWSNNETGAAITNLSVGIYEVLLSDANGCTEMGEVTLTAPNPLRFTADYIDPNCDGAETGIIQLDTIWGGTPPYLFALGDDIYSPSSLFRNLSSGTYDFSILDANGCFTDTTSSLTVPDIPELDLGDDLTTALGCSVLISATTNNTNLINISWDNADGYLDCDSCLETSADPLNNTEFVLTVTSVDNCSTSDSVLVTVSKIRDVFIPNAFSPNGDGINDFFFINANKSVSQIKELNVYNRWGALMYTGTNLPPNQPSSGWDGVFKGRRVNNGVFVWTVAIEYLDGEVLLMSGEVVLML